MCGGVWAFIGESEALRVSAGGCVEGCVEGCGGCVRGEGLHRGV